jgi:hypothetical protein
VLENVTCQHVCTVPAIDGIEAGHYGRLARLVAGGYRATLRADNLPATEGLLAEQGACVGGGGRRRGPRPAAGGAPAAAGRRRGCGAVGPEVPAWRCCMRRLSRRRRPCAP